MHRSILALFVWAAACGGPQTTETVEVAPPPEPAPVPAPAVPEPAPQPEPEPEPAAPKTDPDALVRFTGRIVVATEVERTQLRCTAAAEGASLLDNRRACVAELQGQLKDPKQAIIVVDELEGQGCPTCVSMLAEATPVAADHPGTVLFLADTAGEVTCSAGDGKMTLEQARTQCYETLARQGASLRATVVLPLAVEEGGCKGCTSIAGVGYTTRVLPR